MKLLLDTQLLLCAALAPDRLSGDAFRLIEDPASRLNFSVASIWEVILKRRARSSDLEVDPKALRRGLVDNGYSELPITGAHLLAIDELPALHGDPFDRILVAQSIVEGLTLLTSDSKVAQYPGPVRRI